MKETPSGIPDNQGEKKESRELTPAPGVSPKERSWEDMPHEELVGIIKDAVTDARERCDRKWGKGTFDPVEWIDFRVIPFRGRGTRLYSPEQYQQARHLARAWAAIGFPHMQEGQYKRGTREGVDANARQYGRYVTLEPKGVKLLDAMAEAVGIPRARGEARIDTLQNFPPAQQKDIEEFHARLMSLRAETPPAERKKTANYRAFLRSMISEMAKPTTPREDENREDVFDILQRLVDRMFPDAKEQQEDTTESSQPKTPPESPKGDPGQ